MKLWLTCLAVILGIALSCLGLLRPGQVQAGTKWHPGNYVIIGVADNGPQFLDRHREEIAGNSDVQGVMKKLFWGELEPQRGEYDFSEVDALLERLRPQGKYLFLEIWDRSFVDGCQPGRPMPAYIYHHRQGTARSPLVHAPDGCAAALWDPWVMDRFIQLMRALGERYDANPYLHGIRGPESALDVETDYDRVAYKQQFIRLFTETRRAFPHSLVLASLNYLGGGGKSSEENLRDIAQVVERQGGGLATPDAIPSRETPFNAIARRLRGQVAIAPSAETSFIQLDKDTPEAIYRFNVGQLGANFLFWATWHRDDSHYLENQVVPGLRAIAEQGDQFPAFPTACPRSLECR